MKIPMISVVIPSFRRPEGMLALLADVYRQEGADFEVIVVDDCSPDDSVAIIRENFPEVRLFVNEKNGGPAVTRNRGIREARGEIIVGFDSDVTVPDTSLLSKVSAAFQTAPEASGFAFRILTADGAKDDAPRWWHPVPLEIGKDREFETDYFSGTAYAFRKEPLVSAGLYPEILYMHYEEVELAHRILDGGGRILYSPGFSVLHHANEVSRRSEITVYYKPRNQILLAVSCLPLWNGVCYVLPRMVFQFAKALKGRHLADFRRAVRDGVKKSRMMFPDRKPLKKSTLSRIRSLRRAAPV